MAEQAKIGILSDSHGHWPNMERALRTLADAGAELLVHCGDVGSIQCMRLLGEAGGEAYAVAGNMDAHVPHLAETAAAAGVSFTPRSVEVALADGRFLVATHGNDRCLVRELLAEKRYAYLCRGHTHRRSDERVGTTRIINPGAVWRADPATVALLDAAADTVEFLTL